MMLMTALNHSNTSSIRTQRLLIGLFAFFVLLSGCQPNDSLPVHAEKTSRQVDIVNTTNGNNNAKSCQNDTVVKAFRAKQSNRQVQGCGTIIKALADDNEGSRHQKILIELDGVSPKQTLLLVHNIDLAPRVANVSPSTAVSFYGEYVYNDKGGLVHWTHHDPAARHQGGWIESNGVRYQ